MKRPPTSRARLRAAALGFWGCLLRAGIHLAALVALVLLWTGGRHGLFWTLLTVLVVEWLLAAATGQAVKEEAAEGGAGDGGWRQSTAIAWLTWVAVAANLGLTVYAYVLLI